MVLGDEITIALVVPLFPVSYSLFTPTARLLPRLVPPHISIHPFTVMPFCVTSFSRCRPKCHYIVIYRSGITFLAPRYFLLLICVLFLFGNRLLKKQHTHTRTRAREPANFWNDLDISILAFIIQAYGSVLSPFSVIGDVSSGSGSGSGGGGGNNGGGMGRTESATSAQLSPTPSSVQSSSPSSFLLPSYPILAGTGTSTDERGNLGRVMSSVVGSACLRAEGGVGPQLTSHVFGLLKARVADGQGYEMNAEDRWLATDEGTEWVISTVDSILDVVAPAPSQSDLEAKAKL